MAPIPQPVRLPQVVGPKFFSNANLDPALNLPPFWFEFNYNGRTLKYTVELLGSMDQPRPGFPMYIAMHGGGSNDDLAKANRAWRDVAVPGGFFRGPVAAHHKTPNESAVLVCVRGVSSFDKEKKREVDDWDLHCRPESCVLLEAMITSLIKPFASDTELSGSLSSSIPSLAKYQASKAPHGVFIDPNRVVLWGFSAGGDGAFRIGTKIPDRFAAVVAAAGHPGETRFTNAANVPMLLQVGEDDRYPRDIDLTKKIKWQRANVYLSQAHQPLFDLHQRLSDADKDTFYQYACYVVKNAFRGDPNPGVPHGYWMGPKFVNSMQDVLKRGDLTPDKTNYSNFAQWLAGFAKAGNPPGPPEFTLLPPGDRVEDHYEKRVINPLTDPLVMRRVRHTVPRLVIWDLDWRGERPGEAPDSTDSRAHHARFFYWFYVRLPDAVRLGRRGGPSGDGPEMARLEPAVGSADAHTLRVLTPNIYMGYLLKSDWLNKKIAVYLEQSTTPFWTGTVARVAKIEEQTLKARGDLNLQFSAMVYFQEKDGPGGGWEVKLAQSLDG